MTTTTTDTVEVDLHQLVGIPFLNPRRGGHWLAFTPTLMRRLVESIEVTEEGCWRWMRRPTPCGYAQLRIGHDVYLVHHLLHDLVHGVPPEGMQRGHLCHDGAVQDDACSGGPSCLHRACVRPDHLAAQTRSENLAAGCLGRSSRKS